MSRSSVRGLDPHLFVGDATAAAEFYGRTFGAVEVFRNVLPDDRVLFLELAVGPARLLLSEPFAEIGAHAAKPDTILPLLLHLEVDNPDEVVRRAVLLGAVIEQPVEEQFWGERYGVIRDPFGFRWSVSTARQTMTFEDLTDRTPPDVTGESSGN